MENNTKHTQCGINNIREAAKEKSLEYSSPDEQSIAFFSFEAGAKEQSEKDKVIIDKLVEALKDVNERYIASIGNYYNTPIDRAAYREKANEINLLLNPLNIK